MTRKVALQRQQCLPGTEEHRDLLEEALRAGIATFKQIHFDVKTSVVSSLPCSQNAQAIGGKHPRFDDIVAFLDFTVSSGKVSFTQSARQKNML